MGIALVIIKIMPESKEINLESIKEKAIKIIEKNGGKNINIEEQNIAFGLRALMIKTAIPEEIGTDSLETELSKIKSVSSVSIEDYRRAFG